MKKAFLYSLVLIFLEAPVAGLDESSAPEQLPFDVFIVAPQPFSGFEIRWSDLFGALAGKPLSHETYGPFHGELSATADGLYYAARPSLWEVEVDSFVLDYTHTGVRRTINVIIAVGEAHKGESEWNSFDWPVTGDSDWQLQDPAGILEISASALWVSAAAQEEGFVYFVTADDHPLPPPLDVYDSERVHPGSTTTGSGTGVLLNPPPAGNYGVTQTYPSGQVVFAAGPEGLADSIKARVRGRDGGIQARIEAVDETRAWHESAWVELDAGRANLLAAEYDHPPGNAPETVRLMVNGEVGATLELEAGALPHHLDEHRIGGIEAVGLDLRIDDAEVYRYAVHPGEEPLRTDDFESGSLGGWETEVGTGLAVSVREAVGRMWLEADLAHGDSFLVDSTAGEAARARLRFDLDPAAALDDPVDVLAIHSAHSWTATNEYLRVRVQTPPMRLQVSIFDYGWHDTGWLEPSSQADAHHVEIELVSASAPGAADGSLRVWLGDELAVVDGLADPVNRVGTVRFGVMQVGEGRSGKLYLDNFQLWVPHVPVCENCK